MPNEAVLHEIEIGELIVAVDDSRDAADPFKLTTALRTVEVSRLALRAWHCGCARRGRAGRACGE